MRRVLSILALASAALVIMASGAATHAKFSKAEPAPGSTVPAAPKTVQIWFSMSGMEELHPRLSTIAVSDSRDQRVDDGKGGVDLMDMDRRSLIARLKPIGPGVYTVKWKAVSTEDKDVATGTFTFTLAKP